MQVFYASLILLDNGVKTPLHVPTATSWCKAFCRNLPLLRSSARTVYPLPAAGPRSVASHRASVCGQPQARLHSCDGRSPWCRFKGSHWLVWCVRVWQLSFVFDGCINLLIIKGKGHETCYNTPYPSLAVAALYNLGNSSWLAWARRMIPQWYAAIAPANS